MAYLPYVRSIDKLFNNDWRNIFYGEPAETWQEKLDTLVHESWTQFLSFVESRRKQFINYWLVYAAFFTGTCIILAIHKSVRYVETIKLRKKRNSERRIEEHNRYEVSKIISNVADDEKVEESCSTSQSDLDSATTTKNNDLLDTRRESSISSEITIVADKRNEINDLLRNLINSIEPGDDGMLSKKIPQDVENTEMVDLTESTREKIDSKNCKQFYVLTPWLEPPEVSDMLSQKPEKNSSSSIENAQINARDAIFRSRGIGEKALNENVFFPIESVKSTEPKETMMNGTNDGKKSTWQMGNSTMVNSHESSSICCADEVLSELSDSGENIVSQRISSSEDFIQKTELESLCRVGTKDFPRKLPVLDFSPISRNLKNVENPVDVAESVVLKDSKHRFRSLSHEHRTASSAEYLDTRRGGSVSPPSRNENKQRSTKQSKIPTLTPSALRTMQHHEETGGSISEAANQIRRALLRKLRQVWEEHPRDTTLSPNRSKNSSLESSIYYTPEGVSRIPLPRRSPRHSNANDLTHSPRCNEHGDRLIEQTDQSRDHHIEMTNEPRLPDNVSPVLLHSTPKSSYTSSRFGGRR